MELHEFLSSATAGEIMVPDVVTLKSRHFVFEAAAILMQEQISGAPVIDDSGVCVGVFSVSDVILAEQKVAKELQKVATSSFFNSNLALPESVYADKLAQVRDKIVAPSEQPVERFMTSDVVSVSEETPLASVIQKMVDAHVHRVIVLDANRRLQGIVSTTDVLAAFLRAGRRTAPA